jgi:hypothetical protein
LIKKLNTFVEIDSKDAKFNETFSQIRAQQGKLTTANDIEPDLRIENDDLLDEEPATQSDDSISDNDGDEKQQDNQQHEQEKSDRPQRLSKPRDFLLPGTISQKEIDIRKVQYANMCVESSEPEAQVIYILDCMGSKNDEESKLMKELELMNACTYNIEPNEVLLSSIMQSNEINLSISDPKSQNEIDRMLPKDAARFNDATIAEVKGMKHKDVFEYTTIDKLPKGTKLCQSIVNWTSKMNLGVYVKTKCRICFGRHIYDRVTPTRLRQLSISALFW